MTKTPTCNRYPRPADLQHPGEHPVCMYCDKPIKLMPVPNHPNNGSVWRHA